MLDDDKTKDSKKSSSSNNSGDVSKIDINIIKGDALHNVTSNNTTYTPLNKIPYVPPTDRTNLDEEIN